MQPVPRRTFLGCLIAWVCGAPAVVKATPILLCGLPYNIVETSVVSIPADPQALVFDDVALAVPLLYGELFPIVCVRPRLNPAQRRQIYAAIQKTR